MAIGRFREGDFTEAEKEAMRTSPRLSHEELQKRQVQRDNERSLAEKLVEITRKSRPRFRDTRQAQLYELCKKAVAPHRTAYCMICQADLDYQGSDQKCRVYCPDCGINIEFTDLDKIKAN